MAKRRYESGSSFSLKRFFRDYPIIPITTVMLGIGVLIGYSLGQKGFGWHYPKYDVLKSQTIRKTFGSTPVSMAATPEPFPERMVEKLVGQEKTIPTERMIQPQAINEKVQKPRIVFVIDDIGYNKKIADLLFSLDHHVTLAILPGLPYSKYFAEEGKKRGFPTILHLPLEPEDQEVDSGPGKITMEMSANEIKEILEKDLKSVPGVLGVNNHMGSRATRDRALMYMVLKELKQKQLIFLDSMTSPRSNAHKVAYALGMPVLKRDVFLDNQDDFDYISKHIEETEQVAKQAGIAVAIGHYREKTLSAIKQATPRLESEGFELATLKDIS